MEKNYEVSDANYIIHLMKTYYDINTPKEALKLIKYVLKTKYNIEVFI